MPFAAPPTFVVRDCRHVNWWRWGLVGVVLVVALVLTGCLVPFGVCVLPGVLAILAAANLIRLGGPQVFRSDCLDWIAFGDRLEASSGREMFLDQLVRLELSPHSREDYAEAADRAYKLTAVFKHETWRILATADDWSPIADWARERGVKAVNLCEAVG